MKSPKSREPLGGSGRGGCRLKLERGSHFPGQILKAASPSVVRFGQLSGADNPRLSVKRGRGGFAVRVGKVAEFVLVASDVNSYQRSHVC